MDYLKKVTYTVLLVLLGITTKTFAQDLQNFGELQIFSGSFVGVYSDWVNQALLLNNQGLLGFHGVKKQHVYGSAELVTNDIEINNAFTVASDINITMENNLNFVFGDLTTDKTKEDTSIIIESNAFYIGENHLSKIDGYCTVLNASEFLFPIGDNLELKPLKIVTNTVSQSSSAAYFRSNPLNNADYSTADLNNNKGSQILEINREEYWVLKANVIAKVTINWSKSSFIENISNSLTNLLVVGWHKNLNEWRNLGAESITGSLEEGFITSDSFNPDDYSMLTIGTNLSSFDDRKGYMVSPNGDGVNDYLEFYDLTIEKNDVLQIYHRNGALVFKAIGLQGNFFDGTANHSIVPGMDNKLSNGVYFYLLHKVVDGKVYQGFLYLDR